jgi:hypothetical protein
MCHSTAQKILFDLCATGRHKMCHRKAQNISQEGTKCATARHKKTFRLMCHRKAHNVPQEGTKCATGRHKMCHRKAQNVPQIIRAGRAALAAKNCCITKIRINSRTHWLCFEMTYQLSQRHAENVVDEHHIRPDCISCSQYFWVLTLANLKTMAAKMRKLFSSSFHSFGVVVVIDEPMRSGLRSCASKFCYMYIS